MKAVFQAWINTNGTLKLHDRPAFEAHVATLPRESMVRLTLEPWTRRRSGNQNRYYWGVLLAALAEETGHTPDELHVALRRHYLPASVVGRLEIAESTTELEPAEFETYLERIRADAATGELIGAPLRIPAPHELA